MSEERICKLAGGLNIRGPIRDLSLFYEDTPILLGCSAFSYISDKFIVLKQLNNIYVFPTNIVKNDIHPIAVFNANDCSHIDVKVGNTHYVVTNNCEIIIN